MKVIVTGDYACFTRPEMKVERVSYDVPTPGAIEGMLKAVYWKPAIRYVVDKIVVYNPINFINIRRNEIKEKISLSAVKKAMKSAQLAQSNQNSEQVNMLGETDADNFVEAPRIYASEQRTQRAGMILREVKYGIEFHFEMTGIRSDKSDESEEKHYNIILRRLRNGQFFKQPCLGCREFSVKTLELVDDFDLSEVSHELKGERDLGYMLYGMKFEDGGHPLNDNWETPLFYDNADAMFYRPRMIDGVIDVKKYMEDIKC